LLFQLSWILIFIGLTIFILCLRVYNLYEIKPTGNNPTNLLIDKLVDNEKQELAIVCTSIATIEYSLNFNELSNKNRARELSTVFKTVQIGLWSIVIYSILYLSLERLL